MMFIGPRRLSTVTRKVVNGEKWHGRRYRMQMHIELTEQATFAGERVRYRGTFLHQRIEGIAGTVREAFDRFEEFYQQRTTPPDRRRTKTKKGETNQ